MTNSILAVCIAMVRPAIQVCDGDLEARVRAGMEEAKALDFPIRSDDRETQLQAALGAALMETEGDDKERLERSISRLSRFGASIQAAQNGVPVDFAVLLDKMDDGFEPLPLVQWWHECLEGNREARA